MRHHARFIVVLAAALASTLACGASGPVEEGPTSVLLVVMDTTRMDAVSAYGHVADTTPYLDSLAQEGLLYRFALAPAPWTLPSHATLFSSLGPERHGVGVKGRVVLAPEVTTLAESMRDAGFETIGFTENPVVSAEFGLADGFQHFEGERDAAHGRKADDAVIFDPVLGVTRWSELRSREKAFFLFVNLIDPHDPYRHRPGETRLPEGADLADALRLAKGAPESGIAEYAGICDRLPPPRDLEILRALYEGEVRATDAKLRQIHEAAKAAAPGPLITVVTSDHGEHLGEHRLLGHEFSLRSELLHVPLVVHGVPGSTVGEVPDPVGLIDIAPSIANWAGIDAPEAWEGQLLPIASAAPDAGTDTVTEPRRLRAHFSDAEPAPPKWFGMDHGDAIVRRRRGCSASDLVFGEMLSLVEFPYKLIAYEQGTTQLYDLRWDRRELSDIAAHHPDVVAKLGDGIAAWRRELDSVSETPESLPSPEAIRMLQALGYLDTPTR